MKRISSMTKWYSTKKYTLQKLQDERGAASIIITMVIMVVIALVVLGFASVSRREQRQALDAQLQTQAFYAAESGINEARKIIETNIDTAGVNLERQSCSSNAAPYTSMQTSSELVSGVAYTCVLVDDKPSTLTNTSVTDSSGWVVSLNSINTSGNPVNPDSFQINWRPSDPVPSGAQSPTTACPDPGSGSATRFQSTSARTCRYPVLRIDLVDTTTVGSAVLSNTALRTFFLQPRVGPSDTFTFGSVAPAGSVWVGRAQCTNNYSGCSVTIGTTGTLRANMAMRITSIYGASTVSVNATHSSGPVRFQGGQIVIDSTGKAQDVLRRVQVRIPVDSGGIIPDAALQSGMSVCKRFTIYERGGQSFTIDPNIDATLRGSDPMCGS